LCSFSLYDFGPFLISLSPAVPDVSSGTSFAPTLDSPLLLFRFPRGSVSFALRLELFEKPLFFSSCADHFSTCPVITFPGLGEGFLFSFIFLSLPEKGPPLFLVFFCLIFPHGRFFPNAVRNGHVF